MSFAASCKKFIDEPQIAHQQIKLDAEKERQNEYQYSNMKLK